MFLVHAVFVVFEAAVLVILSRSLEAETLASATRRVEDAAERAQLALLADGARAPRPHGDERRRLRRRRDPAQRHRPRRHAGRDDPVRRGRHHADVARGLPGFLGLRAFQQRDRRRRHQRRRRHRASGPARDGGRRRRGRGRRRRRARAARRRGRRRGRGQRARQRRARHRDRRRRARGDDRRRGVGHRHHRGQLGPGPALIGDHRLRRHDPHDRRADEPARAERRDRGRARGRERQGFAVVADEVRKLAEESAEAANSTSAIINDIAKMTERVAALAGEGAARTETSVKTVARSRGEFEGIAASAREVAGARGRHHRRQPRGRARTPSPAAGARSSSPRSPSPPPRRPRRSPPPRRRPRPPPASSRPPRSAWTPRRRP